MKPSTPKAMTSEQIVTRFAEIGVAQDYAMLGSDIAEYNRLFKAKVALVEELKARGSDQRRLLLKLYAHPNMQVRLNAAKATLAVAPGPAKEALQALTKNKLYSQAGDAGMCLWALEQGIFKPT
jgi:hypothetical protein